MVNSRVTATILISATLIMATTILSGSGCLPWASVSVNAHLWRIPIKFRWISVEEQILKSVTESPGSRTATGTALSTISEGLNRECTDKDRILTNAILLYLPEGSIPTLVLPQLGQVTSTQTPALKGGLTDAPDLIAKPGQIDILDQASAAYRLQEKGVHMCADMCAVARVCIRTCC